MEEGAPAPRKLEDPSTPASNEFAPFLMMDDILERLKMLDYEVQFKTFKPLTHTYFAMAGHNPNEQFYYFMSLVSWLMSLLGHNWRAPSQMDDPNSSASSLYAQLQQVGAPTNFQPQKLKVGYGEACCTVLKFLLEQIPIEFKPAVHRDEVEYEEAAVDDDVEVDVPDMADEVGAADVEEEEYYHGGGSADTGRERGKLTDGILDSQVAPEAWRIELERVTPQLKMQVLSDPKEWRNRLVNTKSHQQTLAQLAPETNATLERLADDLDRTLQALRKAEAKLNAQCQTEVSDYVDKQDELQAKQEECNKQSEYINTLTNELAAVSDELLKIKERMDQRGNSMTDTSPLIKMKTALSRLRTEAKQLEIRIGVVTHTLVAKKLKQNIATKQEAAVPKNNHLQQESYMDDDLED
mmetsp:Transcript_30120/g.49876  ORF Transcript_30120/g.49876 Transcript_30120/m.49876 type:complete len:410 (+) Transcript_30120:46-1275(+)